MLAAGPDNKAINNAKAKCWEDEIHFHTTDMGNRDYSVQFKPYVHAKAPR